MALVLKSSITQSQDGSQLFIEVVEATGLYNAVDNPGGFGTPNPNRNNLALVFYGNHKRQEQDVLAVPLAHDPLTVESYTLNLANLNGVVQYYVFAVPVFNPVGVYADGDVTYDNQTPGQPFLKKRVAGVWQTITSADLIALSIVVRKDGYAFPIAEMTFYKQGLNKKRLLVLRDVVRGETQTEDYDQLRNEFDYVDSELEAAVLDFCSGAYSEAQFKLETLEGFAKQNPLV